MAADEYWTQLDGKKILVGDMDLNHLRNTLRMLIRNNRLAKEKLKQKDFTLNGDMAQESIRADEEGEEEIEDYPWFSQQDDYVDHLRRKDN